MLNQLSLQPAQVGWVGYANYYPVALFLTKALSEVGVSWSEGVPREVNNALRSAQLVAALSSSVAEILIDGCTPLIDYGVSCDGAVDSVYLGIKSPSSKLEDYLLGVQHALAQRQDRDLSRMHHISTLKELRPACAVAYHGEIPPLYLGAVSETSAMLARIFYEVWFGGLGSSMKLTDYMVVDSASQLKLAHDATAVPLWQSGAFYLMIGDDAFRMSQEFDLKIDLGEAWKALTGLPFVFAKWFTLARFSVEPSLAVIRSCLHQSIADADRYVAALSAGAAIDLSSMMIESSSSSPQPYYNPQLADCVDLVSYWQKISYHLSAEAKQSSALFLALAKQLVN